MQHLGGEIKVYIHIEINSFGAIMSRDFLIIKGI